MIEIQVELRYAPDAPARAVIDNNGSTSETDLAQIGASVLLTTRPRRRLRKRLHKIDAAERPIRLLRGNSGRRKRRICRRAWRGGTVRCRMQCMRELERKRTLI